MNHSQIYGEEPKMLFDSEKFISLKAPLLKLLLKRDDLGLDEIVIWDSLLKWGIAQNPSISQDTTEWSDDDNKIMERTLHEFIPLIRFYHISSEDFLGKVYSLKKLLPEGLVDDLMTFYNTPNMKSNIDVIQPPRHSKCAYDSILIKNQHFVIFASWIDKKKADSHYNVKNIPYGFNLLYRASRDGHTSTAFHAKCNGKGATIVVAKVKNSEQIVGGYNPFSWNSNKQNISTINSFIYSFTDRKDIKTAKVGYSNGNEGSIGNYPQAGPMFGGGCDLFCDCDGKGGWYANRVGIPSYPKIDGMPTFYFNVNDYEVFQVIKN